MEGPRKIAAYSAVREVTTAAAAVSESPTARSTGLNPRPRGENRSLLIKSVAPKRRRRQPAGSELQNGHDSARRGLRWAANWVALALVVIAWGCGGVRAPNILLVTINSLRADHLTCYGHFNLTSPVIDAVAGEGVLFKKAIAPSPWTLPSHMSMLSSLAPRQHQVTNDDTKLRDETVLLSEVLADAGYATAGFVSGPYVKAIYGFSRGFDLYDDFSAVRRLGRPEQTIITSPILLEKTSEWFDSWDRDGREKPFFMFLHMFDVHYDYNPPAPYKMMFDPDYKGPVTGIEMLFAKHFRGKIDPRNVEHLAALYDAEIRFTDFHLGEILKVLRNLGVYDNTILVVTADHGEEFFEHGWMSHRRTLYDESIHVPLIMRYPPGIPAGVVVEQMVRTVDVAPTILSLAQIPKPENFGASSLKAPHAERDLTGLIRGGTWEDSPPLLSFGQLHGGLSSVRSENLKLIQRDKGAAEFYDLVKDPREQSRLKPSDSPEYEALSKQLRAWRLAAHPEKLSQPQR